MTQWQCILRDISKFTHLAHPGPFIHSFIRLSAFGILCCSPPPPPPPSSSIIFFIIIHISFNRNERIYAAAVWLFSFTYLPSHSTSSRMESYGPATTSLSRERTHRIPFQGIEERNIMRTLKIVCAVCSTPKQTMRTFFSSSTPFRFVGLAAATSLRDELNRNSFCEVSKEIQCDV